MNEVERDLWRQKKLREDYASMEVLERIRARLSRHEETEALWDAIFSLAASAGKNCRDALAVGMILTMFYEAPTKVTPHLWKNLW